MPETAETALEQTFSDLANARLRDKSPALLDYLAGFQLVKANDDGSKAIGIFGFEIGDSWHYAPVFFLNGEVKGLDSLYSVDSDLFVPLSEDWVNLIINRRPNQLGETDSKSRDERGVRAPNYNRLRQVPSSGSANLGLSFNKTSADLACGRMQDWRQDKTASLPDLVASMGKVVASGFIHDIKRFPKLSHAIQKFYSLADFYVPSEKTAAAKEDDVVIISTIAQDGADKLSDEDKKKVIGGGVAVVDERPEMAKSIVYRNETHQTLQNPTSGGLYEILMADGSVAELLCLRIAGSDDMLVYDPDSGKHGGVQAKKLFAIRQHEPAAFRKKLDEETVAPDAVRPRDCVVFCQQTGESTFGFQVDEVSAGANGMKTVKVRSCYWPASHCSAGHMRAWGFSLDGPAPWRAGSPEERVREILITDAGSGAIRYTKNKLVVNERRFRALVLNRYKESDDSSYGGYTKEVGEIQFRESDFGDHNTIRVAFEKTAAPLKVWSTSDDLHIRDQFGTFTFGKVAALGYLVRNHGCDARDAEIIIKEASRDPALFRVKYAAELLPFPMADDEQESGMMSNYHKTKVPTIGVEKANPASNREFYQYQSPFGGNGEDEEGSTGSQKGTMDTLDQAAQTGQKEVFDASVLNSLIKNHNPTDLVERFLPTIVSGMDRLGRLLFLLNWHYEEFQDRYGKADLLDFTDNLKSTFESLGDLVVFMRKRTLSGDPESYGLGVNATMEG